MLSFLKRCLTNDTSYNLQNQNISTVPILRAHRKEKTLRGLGITTLEQRGIFQIVADKAIYCSKKSILNNGN